MNWNTMLKFLDKLMGLPNGFTCHELFVKVSFLGLTEQEVQAEIDNLIEGGVLKATTEGYEMVH